MPDQNYLLINLLVNNQPQQNDMALRCCFQIHACDSNLGDVAYVLQVSKTKSKVELVTAV